MASQDSALVAAERCRSARELNLIAPLLIAKTSQHNSLSDLLRNEILKNGEILNPDERLKVIFKASFYSIFNVLRLSYNLRH
ncbi:hypothetical protein PR048_025683 [Dryococelus australis]|uniref:Uncharacterized protein n=1 Tax=Dryococelus australis TaxID=614101 RepID=A0ABQ9GJ92_9NEOP|nr:hypothetical protein PR048_025683 [Dryococelus australis]